MAKRGANYTAVGKKISQLARNQSEIADALDLTQQSVSGKLNGRIAITMQDLERLAETYDVPLLFFMTPESITPELARVWARIQHGPHELHMVMQMAVDLPTPFLQQCLKVVRAVHETAGVYQGRMGSGPREF